VRKESFTESVLRTCAILDRLTMICKSIKSRTGASKVSSRWWNILVAATGTHVDVLCLFIKGVDRLKQKCGSIGSSLTSLKLLFDLCGASYNSWVIGSCLEYHGREGMSERCQAGDEKL
jgi:hypothetical protein